MVITEAELRDQVRRPTLGAQVSVPAGARLSPSAADFVKQWQLKVVEVSDGAVAMPQPTASDTTFWDRAAEFPVKLTGEIPRCTCCGNQVATKADSLTQLNAYHFAPKTHPRIRLRGRVDSLHSLVLMAGCKATQSGPSWLAADLSTIAAYCRELTSAEYNERQVADLRLGDVDVEAIHKATHDPEGQVGVPHLTLSVADVELQHWLNLCRTTAREIEIVAQDAFGSPHHPYGAHLCHAFNRLSSAFYYLQLRLSRETS